MGRAIVRNPKVFLMDEPLSNLDAKLRVQMRTEISRLQQQLGTTTIYVTHDQTEAMTLGDRIAVMRAGVLQQVGSPAELYAHPNNLFVAGFIGSPSMNFLPGEIDGESVHLPIGTVRIPNALRRALRPGPAAGADGVIAGLRPEHFEDAERGRRRRPRGHAFTAKIDVLESMGSEFYAYFVVESERVSASELEELAQDAGAADLPRSRDGSQVVARLDAASRVQAGRGGRAVVRHARTCSCSIPRAGRACSAPTGPARQPQHGPGARVGHLTPSRKLGAPCPSGAPPGCRTSMRSTTSCARAGTRPWPGWSRACAASPTTSA